MKERLQKIIANSGYCSRRAAEKLISVGKVTVNGEMASTGDSADAMVDTILVEGNPLHREVERSYIMLNKPRGYISSMRDEKGRKTVADLTSDAGTRVYPVGRLDCSSEGLIIMTDDGELANFLMHPSHEIPKTYQTRVCGEHIEASAAMLRTSLEIDGEMLNPANVKILDIDGDRGLLSITITEGKNRQIRKMCNLAGLEVLRLKRVSEGKLLLGNLPSGKWRYLTDNELRMLQSV